MVKTDHMTPKEAVTRIGEAYVETDRLPYEGTSRCGALYASIADTVKSLFQDIEIDVVFQERDPYDSYLDMAKSVGDEGVLRVYNQHTDHPEFSHEETLQFRAVHDWCGHLKYDVDFSPEGEWRKWDRMREHFSPDENAVMFSEVVCQTGAVHYLPDGFNSDRYVQRAFVAPVRWMRLMRDAVEN